MSYTYLTAQQLAEKFNTTLVLFAINLKIVYSLKVFTIFALLVDEKFFLFGNVLKPKCLNLQV